MDKMIYKRYFTAVGMLIVFGALSPNTLLAIPAAAESLLKEYAQLAKRENPGFQGFQAGKGKELFFLERRHTKKNEMRSCTTCHTNNPKTQGKTLTGKPIDPLSPQVNPKRLTVEQDIRKWFRRNCTQVLERECTATEKGDFLHFLLNI